MAAKIEEHNLKLLNKKVNALLENERYDHAVKDNLTFNFDRPNSLLRSRMFSLLLKPASSFKTLPGHTEQILSVAFSPDNKLIASTSTDRTVRLWNIPNGDLNAELKGHERRVNSVAFSPDGKSIVTGSYDNTVRTWSVATKQQVKILNGHSDRVLSVAWSPNGDLIASGSSDRFVRLWDATSGSVKKTLTRHNNWVSCIYDETVKMKQCFLLLDLVCFVLTKCNKLASAGSYDKTAIIWDVNSGAFIKLAHSNAVLSVCFSPDDQFVVTCCYDNIVRMFNANTGRQEKRFEGHTNAVCSVAFSFDGSMIASGSWDKSVRLWHVASTKQLQQLDEHTNRVNLVAFSRDGKFIASASDDKTVRLWNMPSLFLIPHQPKEHEEEEEKEENRKRRKIDHK